MKITKEALVPLEPERAQEPALAAELEAVNAWTKTPLRLEEVYLFAVRLCDNQVDRDGEFFDRAALEQLAPLFHGKSGIFDHAWSAKNQTARIYKTEVISEPGVVPESGESACYLKGYAYMLRSEGNQELIAEIEGGIKKEVSVSCAVSKRLCSICGNEIGDRVHCSHVAGQVYEDRRCVVRLADPTDAFEWSFVAVPAQKKSGVVKAMKGQEEKGMTVSWEELPLGLQEEVKALQKEAAWGRRYVEQLRNEVLRLGRMARKSFSPALLSSMVAHLEEAELLALKTALEDEAAKLLPIRTQLSYGKPAGNALNEQDSRENQLFCI